MVRSYTHHDTLRALHKNDEHKSDYKSKFLYMSSDHHNLVDIGDLGAKYAS